MRLVGKVNPAAVEEHNAISTAAVFTLPERFAFPIIFTSSSNLVLGITGEEL